MGCPCHNHLPAIETEYSVLGDIVEEATEDEFRA